MAFIISKNVDLSANHAFILKIRQKICCYLKYFYIFAKRKPFNILQI